MHDAYDIAQVCPNGHVANARWKTEPQYNRSFCEKCGEKTETTCCKCTKAIRGEALDDWSGRGFTLASFCQYCGAPFTWTERKQQVAIELFAEECQDAADRDEFTRSIEQITKNTPQAQLAGKRITRLLGKLAKGAAIAIRDIVVDIAAEGVKRTIFSPE